ncbi:RNA-binding transcriptional accessory protein [Chitinophagaceae bacterium LB-8]|uniref:RNA-binding transcriptional accessory protein n=1 Tax=Paraflavisolibacter caeni TaxID=2982496 RepID=A0A9X2XNT3_9BACT|nr:Tex family protein [Paraflavisolibacter caeni]MCU7549044.1 RNA-binding transcriptional accessory protein [Paraflavisolibacter caeni]
MDQKYIQKISEKLGLTLKQVTNVDSLHSEGATIPFMARYRKEATNNLDEVAIGNIVEEIKYFTELDKRKETVIKTIEDAGKMTDDLKKRIEECYSATELEDIYLPYKPKRKTRATQAIEKGLEPLAKLLFEQAEMNLDEETAKYINEQVKDSKDALQGARDIIAEWISEHEQARNKVRQLFTETAALSSKILPSKKDDPEAQKYRDYFEFDEPLSQCPSHRILAIRRGEKEGFLAMDLNVDKQTAVEDLERIFIKASNPSATEVKKAIEDSFGRLLKSSIENEYRLLSKGKADEEAIHVFTENLRQLLLASPLGSKKILALDPGYRTGCKVVCLDAQGNLVYNTAIYPHPPQNQWQESIAALKQMVEKFDIEAIGVGNGTAGRESEQLVRSIDFGKHVSIFQVNESGASIYSASEVAREEFPDHDVTVRGAISIGRRLLDPLSELVKIDPKSIGVGQYQHDVNQLKLKDALDRVVESAVNFVGVDVNTASKHLLQYVSGINATLANNIVQYRAQNGAFKSRNDLKKVSLMGPKTFEQCAGFLRIPGAENPLDNSSVHPESYGVVEQMAKDVQASLEELIKQSELRKKVVKKKYITETVGEFTIDDILKELEKPGRDPRSPIEEFQFDETIKTIEDVKPGMTVPGIVTNITAFGAFVDIGVKQDGLVHLSQLSNRYVTDPNEVVKLNQKVMVTVTEVDVARKRIALSMKDQAPREREQMSRPKGQGAPAQKSFQKKQEPQNDFQSKLMELKKKFKD